MGIRWKQGDYISLGKAVANFNKQISQLENEEKKLILPELMNYGELKQEIRTRRDLNNLIKSLKRINKPGALEGYTLESGISVTKYERKEMGIQQRSAKIQLKKQLHELETKEVRVGAKETNRTMAQMQSVSKNNLKAKIQHSEKNIEKMSEEEFKKNRKRFKNYSTDSYYKKQNSAFKSAYIETIQKYIWGMPGSMELCSKLEKIPDDEFYSLSQQDKITSDISYIYEIMMTAKMQGPTDAQYMLDRLIQAWEVTLERNNMMKENERIYDNDIFEG